MIERLRHEAPNLTGLKVSDLPFEAVKPYLLDGLDVFIGQEPLALEGFDAGAVGCVSGLASAWPEVVSKLVHERDPEAHARVLALRDGLEGIPFLAALKHVLADRGVLTSTDVRPAPQPHRGRASARRLALLATAPCPTASVNRRQRFVRHRAR